MSARTGSLFGDWVQIMAEMPVLPDVPPISDWVKAQGVEIGTENTTYQGETYDFARSPVVARLIASYFEDREANELFLLKPTQSMATTVTVFCLGWSMLFHGGNGIICLHDRDSAREKVKDSVAPMLLKIPALGQASEDAESESTAGALRFSTGVIYIGSGGTKSTLTSIPARVVVLDEAELHPLIDGATSISRARERLTGAKDGGKLIALSKPEKEAILERDDRTRMWQVKPMEGTFLHREYLSGNQLRYVCPCPGCGKYIEPKWPHIRYSHCNAALPEMPPDYDFKRVVGETFWECPECQARVHEGEEKRAWVNAGRWEPKPTAERAGKELFANPVPRRWSAQFSALTDIAFENLHWGRLAVRWIESQGDPAKIRAFRNGILGEPERLAQSADTTLEHLHRLIKRQPLPGGGEWLLRDDRGDLTGVVPVLSNQLQYIGAAFDVQASTLKFTTRAHARDGSTYLLDFGEIPSSAEFTEVSDYLDSMTFTTVDGVAKKVRVAYVDCAHRFHDVIALSVRDSRVEAIKGEGLEIRKGSGSVWKSIYQGRHKAGIYVGQPFSREYWVADSDHWETRLYEDCIQKFNPSRFRAWAPALWCPPDTPDEFFLEFTRMHRVYKRGKMRWERTVHMAKIDYADCDKMHLMMDYNARLSRLQAKGMPVRIPAGPPAPPQKKKLRVRVAR